MLTGPQLKAHLRAIAANDFRAPDGADYWQLTQEMLAHIGSLDPELRDDLIYRTVVKWAGAELYTNDQYRAILNVTLDQQHAFFGLGERDTDSVFTRSFSILASVIPVYNHRHTPFLTPPEVHATLDTVLRYLEGEQDLRGYVEGKGWAHAIAHTADLLDELAQCEETRHDDLLHILQAIADKMSTTLAIFSHEEDERMAYATLSIFQHRELLERDIGQWIKGFAPIERTGEWFNRRVNVKNFLRSLYFQAKHRRAVEWVCAPIYETLYAIGHFNNG